MQVMPVRSNLKSDKIKLEKGIQCLMNIDLGGQSRIPVLRCEFGDFVTYY